MANPILVATSLSKPSHPRYINAPVLLKNSENESARL
jgi:hypothetical protein